LIFAASYLWCALSGTLSLLPIAAPLLGVNALTSPSEHGSG